MRGITPDNEYARARRAAGLSQVDFGRLAGVCFLTVLRFENGRKVRTRTADALTRVYAEIESDPGWAGNGNRAVSRNRGRGHMDVTPVNRKVRDQPARERCRPAMGKKTESSTPCPPSPEHFLEFRLLSSEEIRLAQEFTGTPILGKVVRMPSDSILTRAFKDALVKHREDCGARRRNYEERGLGRKCGEDNHAG